MTRQVRAELAKVLTTRTWVVVLAVLVGYVLLNALALLFLDELTRGQTGSEMVPGLESEQGVRNVWASAGGGYVLTLVFGVLVVTTEYRHRTISATLLAQPHRGRVVAAKLVATALVTTAFAAVATAAVAVVAVPVLAAKDAVALPGGHLAAILVGGVVGMVLYALLGVAVGALVRNQVAALVGALVWVLLVEALLVAFLPSVGRWLPGGAVTSLVQASAFVEQEMLAPWLAAAVLLGYTVVLTVAAVATSQRRDVT
ncbi:MAG: ABC transporter permease [Actinomycetia bacterium]|nr:ABC transporter permease [Actinomycetes bacterium]